MKSPDEIKKGLECCTNKDCHDCPYRNTEFSCRVECNNDALTLIRQLEAERDAAVADMTEMAKYGGENCCEWCDQTECECTCADVGIYAGFNWRGVVKEGNK